MISNPNTFGALLVYWAEEGYEDKVSIAVIRERMRHIKIIEEKQHLM